MTATLDGIYAQRNAVACTLAHAILAIQSLDPDQGVTAGRGVDATQPAEWQNVVYIDLPTGQISFHIHEREAHLFEKLPPYPGAWDGHTDVEKWARVQRFLDAGGNSYNWSAGSASPEISNQGNEP